MQCSYGGVAEVVFCDVTPSNVDKQAPVDTA